MEILRHSQIGQTRRYVKGRSHLAKAAMRRMGDAFMPAPDPPLRPGLRPATGEQHARSVVGTSAERKTPGQRTADLGFQ
jgi:hypothetical protein